MDATICPMNKGKIKTPVEVSHVTKTLEEAGFEAFLVGGCVRDALRGAEPKDWDVTTNALPEEILAVFPHSHYDNDYGTVRVVNDDTEDEKLKVVEVTTYRLEAEYSDGRRPDAVAFSKDIADDLKRRDFTINALAASVSHETEYDVIHETVVDNYGGLSDLEHKVIKCVGNPTERFTEDGLRIMRGVRLAAQLGFEIDPKTEEAIKSCAYMLKNIAIERIRDEFEKMIMTNEPKRALVMAKDLSILEIIIPELLEGVGIDQNQAHSFTVWHHLLNSLQGTADKNWSLEIRLAALFHDISKPYTRRFDDKKKDWTFHTDTKLWVHV